ncbi:muellerian-inhibiting factor [Hemicordylus capensis]|uniref:muellerian-inhibiting factor n=1 Tax=Hemicordylus capensis TaxID=884348 RepID=UPI002304ADA9|nr:muellerian-inhibiting factor [Hemicordylus capensis]
MLVNSSRESCCVLSTQGHAPLKRELLTQAAEVSLPLLRRIRPDSERRRVSERSAMRVVLGGVLLGLSLFLASVPVPGEGILVGEGTQGEAEVSPLREPQTKEEEEEVMGGASDFRGPQRRVSVASDNPEGVQRPPHLAGEEEMPPSLGPGPGFLSWPHEDPEDPVCRVKLDEGSVWGPSHLEVAGLLTSDDSRFLKALRRSTWGQGELETFGLCPPDVSYGTLSSLQRLAGSLADPGQNRFLLLHLEEVKWEAETKLRFKLTFQEDVGGSLGPLQLAVLVFYHGKEERVGAGSKEKFLVGGEGLHQKQVVCLSRGTRYLVFRGSVGSGRHTPGQIIYEVSLAIWRHSHKGSALSSQEAQALLFGLDAKCFTRMTPAVLLLAKQTPEDSAFLPSSFLAASGVLDIVPFPQPSGLPLPGVAEAPPSDPTSPTNISTAPAPASTRQFLEALSQFVNKVLSASGEPPPTSRPSLRLDFDTMEALPHWLLNLSQKVALEQLVQSEDHLVVLYPEDSQALMEQHLDRWFLEGRLFQQLLEKLQAVIQELKAVPSFRANADLFRGLLAFCHYPPGSDPRATEGAGGRSKVHSLLLLKALQAVRARWRESRRLPRAHRSAQHDYCRLRELRIDLVSTGYVILPAWYNANNCVGPCRLPLSTRIPDYYSHTYFLLHMHQQGAPLQRTACCVPVKYSQSLILTFTNDEGIKAKHYPNMVAEACGCR